MTEALSRRSKTSPAVPAFFSAGCVVCLCPAAKAIIHVVIPESTRLTCHNCPVYIFCFLQELINCKLHSNNLDKPKVCVE